MKLAIIGSRSLGNSQESYNLVYNSICKYFRIEEISLIVSGGADGADYLGAKFAKQCKIPLKEYLPNWKEYGRSAGFKRNSNIIENCDKVICFHDGFSKGTLNSIDWARKLKKDTIIIYFTPKAESLEL